MSDDRRRPGAAPASGGPEHDAWLREALRHAPDASAAPPATLRDAILAEARAVTRDPAPRAAAPASPSLLDQALAFWSWLARPQVAAGFASVMAATLVGMLWWDRPMDETMLPPPASPPVAVAPQAAPGPTAATGEATVASERDTTSLSPQAKRDATAPNPVSPTTPTTPAKTAATRAAAETVARDAERTSQAARSVADERARRPADAAKPAERFAESKDDDRRVKARSPADTTPATGAATTGPGTVPSAEAPSPFPARPAAEAAAERRQPLVAVPAPAAAPPSVQAAPAAVPAPAPAAPPPTTARDRPEPFALSKKAEETREVELERARPLPTPTIPPASSPATLGGARDGRGDALSAAGRVAAQNAVPGARPRPAATASTAQPMAPLLAALASEGARWSRRGAGGESLAVDAAMRAWLAQVQAATTSRWEAAADRDARRAAPVAAAAAPVTVRLERDDRTSASIRIENDGVRFEAPGGDAWFASLPPDTVARLRASLPSAPR